MRFNICLDLFHLIQITLIYFDVEKFERMVKTFVQDCIRSYLMEACDLLLQDCRWYNIHKIPRWLDTVY